MNCGAKLNNENWVKLNRWSRDLIYEAGGCEAVGSLTGRHPSQVRKCFSTKEDTMLTLSSWRRIEIDLVGIGLDPIFSQSHLEDLGYIAVKKPDVAPGPDAINACMKSLQAVTQYLGEIGKALEDGEIDSEEYKALRAKANTAFRDTHAALLTIEKFLEEDE